jgi:hypothetical protein
MVFLADEGQKPTCIHEAFGEATVDEYRSMMDKSD